MEYPKLQKISSSRRTIDTFGGYNRNLRIGDGEFFHMKNLTSDSYPVLSPRPRRGIYAQCEAPTGLITKDSLCYTEGRYFCINGKNIDMDLSDSPKELISMGAYVIILPDKKYINTKDLTDFGKIEAETTTQGPVTFTLCRGDSTAYTPEHTGGTAPEEPEDGIMWLDTGSVPNALKQWSAASGQWMGVAATYVKIAATGIGTAFQKYDGITLSGLADTDLTDEAGDPIPNPKELAALEGAAVVWDKGDDFILVAGILSQSYTIQNPITLSRKMPEMDYVIEAGNRLWGCRYGVAANGQVVNELYCSKLGDFKNWSCYMGISTDSWNASLGSDGIFTGAITHLGYPLFFKENCLHKVYISSSGSHQVTATTCRGVQQDCHKSLAIVGEVLYYKSRSGICAYDGSLPTDISAALGNVRYKEAVAGAQGNKYYISMADTAGKYHLFVLDTHRGLWHREDDLRADLFCRCREELYCMEHGTGRILALLGSGEPAEGPVDWLAETGAIGITAPDSKYVSRLSLRLAMELGAKLQCSVRYDSRGGWEPLFSLTGTDLRSFTIPIRPRRCDHLQLRLEGTGEVKLYSLTKTIEEGSDVT